MRDGKSRALVCLVAVFLVIGLVIPIMAISTKPAPASNYAWTTTDGGGVTAITSPPSYGTALASTRELGASGSGTTTRGRQPGPTPWAG